MSSSSTSGTCPPTTRGSAMPTADSRQPTAGLGSRCASTTRARRGSSPRDDGRPARRRAFRRELERDVVSADRLLHWPTRGSRRLPSWRPRKGREPHGPTAGSGLVLVTVAGATGPLTLRALAFGERHPTAPLAPERLPGRAPAPARRLSASGTANRTSDSGTSAPFDTDRTRRWLAPQERKPCPTPYPPCCPPRPSSTSPPSPRRASTARSSGCRSTSSSWPRTRARRSPPRASSGSPEC